MRDVGGGAMRGKEEMRDKECRRNWNEVYEGFEG